MWKLSILLLAPFFLPSTLLAQKVLIPKKGEIIFSFTDSITNEAKLDSSYKELAKAMVPIMTKLMVEQSKLSGKAVDSAEISRLVEAMGGSSPKEMIQEIDSRREHRFLYVDNGIKSYIKYFSDGVEIETFIDTTKIQRTANSLNSEEAEEDNSYQYTNHEQISITEFRDQKKTISGYSCFKILYRYKESWTEANSDVDIGFAKWMGEFFSYKELWVTEEIQSMFHPVCKDQEILKKYYPLAIREFNDRIKGLETFYKLKSINLSN